MYCGRCGTELTTGARFCSQCGTPSLALYAAGPRLERPRGSRVIAGVCSGLARQYRWDLTWVRVLAVLAAILSSGAGLVAYIIFWIIMPEEPLMLPSGAPNGAPSQTVF